MRVPACVWVGCEGVDTWVESGGRSRRQKNTVPPLLTLTWVLGQVYMSVLMRVWVQGGCEGVDAWVESGGRSKRQKKTVPPLLTSTWTCEKESVCVYKPVLNKSVRTCLGWVGRGVEGQVKEAEVEAVSLHC